MKRIVVLYFTFLILMSCGDDSVKLINKDCVECQINAGNGQTANYEYCQVGNDVILTSGNIIDTFYNSLVDDLVADDQFNLGAVCN